MSRGFFFLSASKPKPSRSMVPGRKFSSTTSARAMSPWRMAWPSGAFRFNVRLFLLRFTDMKYVASPPANGGQPRVSSPLPGSSILITSAPMSPSAIAQNGPASTRVRSMTRMPASGGRGTGARRARAGAAVRVFGRRLRLATGSPLEEPLNEALADGGDLLAPRAGPAPEQTGPIGEAHVREVVHGVHILHRHAGADLHALGLLAVAEEARASLQLDQRDVQRRAKSLGRREEGGERDDLTGVRHRRGLHGRAVVGAARRGRHDQPLAARTNRGGQRGF